MHFLSLWVIHSPFLQLICRLIYQIVTYLGLILWSSLLQRTWNVEVLITTFLHPIPPLILSSFILLHHSSHISISPCNRETFSLISTDIHDDLTRESSFYRQALQCAEVGLELCDQFGLKHIRPNDYYAEMLKSDQHMYKVRQQLALTKKKIEVKEQRRAQRGIFIEWQI